MHRLATGGYKDINRSEELFMKCNKETIGRVLIACMMLGSYQIIRQENVFLTKKFLSMFPEWETKRLLMYNKENLEQCSQSTPIKRGSLTSMTL